MSKVVTVAEAKAHISALLSEAESGTDVTITRHGKPIARLVAAPRGPVERIPGDWKWPGHFDPSVFAPMTEEERREEGWL